MSRIFITGFPRSGTSLLLRLLGDTAGRTAFAQPLPLLLSEVRRSFLQSIGRGTAEQAYPFADDQYENYVEPERFGDYLSETGLSADALRQSLQAMLAYSGQRFRPDRPYASLDGWTGGDLSSFIERYFDTHAGGRDPAWVWKELSVEPLTGYLASAGWQTVLIVRDPRQAIASMYFGSGQDHVGQPRPLLFLARQWRRSALYALAQPWGIIPIHYEALIADPVEALSSVPGASPVLTEALTTHNNSSFASGSTRIELDDRDRRFVEALCYSEMTALGYAPEIDAGEIGAILSAGPSDEVLHRPALERFLWSPAREREERDRRRRINAETDQCSAEAFLFIDAYQRLR